MSLPAFVTHLLIPGEPDALVFPDSQGGHMRGTNVRRRWWSDAVAAAELFPRTVIDAGEQTTVYAFKLHELRHTAASLAIQAQHQSAAEHARPRIRGADVGPVRPPLRVGRRGCRCRHQRTFNSKLWAKCGHGW